MIPIISLLVIVSLSVLVTRIATVALTFTGMSREVARFQARSAFAGVGFTTQESEQIVNHPVRRRIVMILMLFGNAGIITVVASLVVALLNIRAAGDSVLLKLVALFAGLGAIWFVATSGWVDRRLSALIGWALKRYTSLDVKDYSSLLHMAGEYKVAELFVEPEDWLAGRRLADVDLEEEGVLVLGITRADGTFIGAPNGASRILSGDTIVVYGRESAFMELDERRSGASGDIEHAEAIEEYKEIVEEERQEDPAERTRSE
ncbi:MAG: TrkA C-terminal domain-containing protein [Proteobacteria bacterium]|nr:TrkA C-terminal domain-containing protein [Pseudomonadota bacterium]